MGDGVHPLILLQGDMHHPAFVGVHGLQLHPAAGTDGFFRHLLRQGGECLLPAFPVAFHVQHQTGVLVAALVHGQIDQILQGVEGLAPAADEDAQIAAADDQPQDAFPHLVGDLRGHTQLGEDGIQEGPGVGVEPVRHLTFGDGDGVAVPAALRFLDGGPLSPGRTLAPLRPLSSFGTLRAFSTLSPFRTGLALPAAAAFPLFFLRGDGGPFRIRLGGDDGPDGDILGLFGLLGGLFFKFFPFALFLAEGGGLFRGGGGSVGQLHVGHDLEIPAADAQEAGFARLQHVPIVQLIDGGIGQGADVGDSFVQRLAGGHEFLAHTFTSLSLAPAQAGLPRLPRPR